MDYRDERDALRGRVDNLEQELGDARRELDAQRGDDRQARIAQIEAQMADAQRLLGRLGSELAELKGPPPARRGAAWRGAVFVVFAVATGVMGFLVVSRPAVVPPPVLQVPEPVQPAPPPPAPPPPTPPPPTPPPAATTPVPATAHATWTARIARATGSAPPAGTACTVEAALAGGEGKVHVSGVTITCGGRAIYRSTDKLNGMSMSSSGAEESAGKAPGTEVYRLGFEDKGDRTGERNEISIDTGVGAGAVWRTSVPAFRVDLSVARQSAPVRGPALAP